MCPTTARRPNATSGGGRAHGDTLFSESLKVMKKVNIHSALLSIIQYKVHMLEVAVEEDVRDKVLGSRVRWSCV